MPKLKVRDKVKIVNVEHCKFGYNPLMLKLAGKTTVITNIYQVIDLIRDKETVVKYRVQIDDGMYSWSANCLKPVDCKFMKNE